MGEFANDLKAELMQHDIHYSKYKAIKSKMTKPLYMRFNDPYSCSEILVHIAPLLHLDVKQSIQ